MSYNIWDDDNAGTSNHSTAFLAEDNPFNSSNTASFDIWKDVEDVLEREDSDLDAEEEVAKTDEDFSQPENDLFEKNTSENDLIEKDEPENALIERNEPENAFFEKNKPEMANDYATEAEAFKSDDEPHFGDTNANFTTNILRNTDDDSIKEENDGLLQDIIKQEDPAHDIFNSWEGAETNNTLEIGAIDIEKNIFGDNNDDIDLFSNDTEPEHFEPKPKPDSTGAGSVNKTHGTNIKKLFDMKRSSAYPLSPKQSVSQEPETSQTDLGSADDVLSSPKKSPPSSQDNNVSESNQMSTETVVEQQKSTPTQKSAVVSQPGPSNSTTQDEKADFLSLSKDPVHSIEISDPYKVGDITNSFIEYKITTILSPKTVLRGRSLENDDEYERTFVVKRRYSDFRWLYRHLQQSYWGRIIPSPPDKSLKNILRVSDKDNFALERKEVLLSMLINIASISELQFDSDYLEFLTNIEVTKFSQYYKIRDQETLSYAVNDPLDLSEISRLSELTLFGNEDGIEFYTEAKGMEVEQYLKKKILQATRRGPSGGSSLTKAIFGFASTVINDDENSDNNEVPRYREPDPFFNKAEDCWDSLFLELKNLDTALKNLKESKEKSTSDLDKLSEVLKKLSKSNITENLNKLYESFSNTNSEVSNVIRRSSDLEKLILSDYVHEQLRSLNNSTSIFNQRYKVGCILVLLEWIVTNKRFGKEILEGENLKKWEKRHSNVKLRWREVGLTIKKQLYRFDIARVIEFRNCIEIYIETCKEQQKELIEIWETFYKEAF